MKLKHIAALAMTAALALSLAACGSAPQGEAEVPEAEVAAEEVVTEEVVTDEAQTDLSVEEELSVTEEEMPVEEAAVALPGVSTYEELIELYQTAFEEEWDMDQLLDHGMSALIGYVYGSGMDRVGFNPNYDFDGDGENELVIGDLPPVDQEDMEPDNMIYAAYTIKDGQVVPVCISSERDRYYMLDLLDNPGEALNFEREGSNSADNSFCAEYRMDGTELILCQAIVYDGAYDSENPWYMSYDPDFNYENATPISEQEANDIISSNQANYFYPGYLGISQGYFVPDPEYAE